MKKIFEDWNKVMVVGEVAQAHDGSLGMAHSYIDAIADAGADAVKFQTHIASEESTYEEPWRVNFSYEDKNRYDYWKRMEFTKEQWSGLKKHAEERNLLFMSTPFSVAAAKLLEDIGVKIWKVSSGELKDPWLFEFISSTGKPIVFSTGMSTMDEIREYAQKLEQTGTDYALLQCTTGYPVGPEKVGLNVLEELIKEYPVVGLSDHSGSIWPSVSAVTLGAKIIEVHVCMNKKEFGPDVSASLTIEQFSEMIDGVRYIERMQKNPVDKNSMSNELKSTCQIFAKSVCASVDIGKGTVLTRDMLALKKPGYGIPPYLVDDIVGKVTRKNMLANQFISFEDLEN